MSENYDEKQILSHFSSDISQDIRKYAEENVLEDSRYLFTRREGKRQYAYCTHCNNETKTAGLIHNQYVTCPTCGSRCQIKASGRGRSKMIDEAYFVYYEKSLLSPDAIVARGIYIVRDYRDNYKNVQTQYLIKAWYLFEMGSSAMVLQNGFYSWRESCMIEFSLKKCKSVYSLYSRHSCNGWGYNPYKMVLEWSLESVKNAIKGTPFQYSTWDNYTGECEDMVKFFDLYSKYPCIEYLTKLGMDELVIAKLSGWSTYGAINWRGKTLQKVLRVSLVKQEIKELKELKISVDPRFLKLLQISKKDYSNLSMLELAEIAKSKYALYMDDLRMILKYTTLRKINVYIKKQFGKESKEKHYYADDQVLRTWRDYISDCIMLNMNLAESSVLFPTNLYQAHQNTIKQVKIKGDELLNKKIKDRLGILKKYCFTTGDLLARPAESTQELIAEGKALHHCVGTYADKYAKGTTVILLIRQTNTPDKPYFTVEVKGEQIVQVRGKNNCNPGKDVSAFIQKFTEKVLTPSKKQKEKTA